ncbi:dentin sialophosphoprotein-like [Hetaerina americana]|uniref:dentin sialophosphoprotein-like n=1 Tax=Hetaerina americana TaxID=62018 RepID=UPI003A7F329E
MTHRDMRSNTFLVCLGLCLCVNSAALVESDLANDIEFSVNNDSTSDLELTGGSYAENYNLEATAESDLANDIEFSVNDDSPNDFESTGGSYAENYNLEATQANTTVGGNASVMNGDTERSLLETLNPKMNPSMLRSGQTGSNNSEVLHDELEDSNLRFSFNKMPYKPYHSSSHDSSEYQDHSSSHHSSSPSSASSESHHESTYDTHDESSYENQDKSSHESYDKSSHESYDKSSYEYQDKSSHESYDKPSHESYDKSSHESYDKSSHESYDASSLSETHGSPSMEWHNKSPRDSYDKTSSESYDRSSNEAYYPMLPPQPRKYFCRSHSKSLKRKVKWLLAGITVIIDPFPWSRHLRRVLNIDFWDRLCIFFWELLHEFEFITLL